MTAVLVTLGARRNELDVVDLLLECHERIRRFCAMAVALATTEELPEAQVRDGAAAVRRYFAEALPLHVADEEEDVVLVLAGRRPDVDAALARMTREHDEHEPELARLVALCAELARDPRRRPDLRAELGALTARLSAGFTAHLELEERVLFPALRELTAADREALRDRIRARRASSLVTARVSAAP